MFCSKCGANVSANVNFCPNCGARMNSATYSTPAYSSALSNDRYVSSYADRYNLILISNGVCNPITAGDLLEDIFGYTDSESGHLIRMAPVVVGENLTAKEASTIAQLYTEYGMQVSITDENDHYVNLEEYAVKSVFDSKGNLLKSVAAIVTALTVANRVSSYRPYKKPSFLESIFRLNYRPEPPRYNRNFRPHMDPMAAPPKKEIRHMHENPEHHFGHPDNHRHPDMPNRRDDRFGHGVPTGHSGQAGRSGQAGPGGPAGHGGPGMGPDGRGGRRP